MKKISIIAGIVAVLFIALFMWALSGASPENAPTDLRTLDVTPDL